MLYARRFACVSRGSLSDDVAKKESIFCLKILEQVEMICIFVEKTQKNKFDNMIKLYLYLNYEEESTACVSTFEKRFRE
jgi:hypothetical protein